MAKRPVYVIGNEDRLFLTRNIEFEYSGGFALAQKRRNINALHGQFVQDYPEYKGSVLDISTASEVEAGVALSAFNLDITLSGGEKVKLECAYQGAKVFEAGGPYTDILKMPPDKAKKDARLKVSEENRLTGFELDGKRFPLKPESLFYNWIYIKAVSERPELAQELLKYSAFTDISFNPEKSVSCQAQAAAIYVTLSNTGKLDAVLADPEELARLMTAKPVYKPVAKPNAEHKWAYKTGMCIKEAQHGIGVIMSLKTVGTKHSVTVRFERGGEIEVVQFAEEWLVNNSELMAKPPRK